MKKHKSILFSAILAVFYIVGLFGILHIDENLFLPLTPFNLLLTLSVFFWVDKRHNSQRFKVALILFVLGFIVELIGVSTGIPFGSYIYEENMGPRLYGTPLIIGVNWCVLTFASQGFLSRVVNSNGLKIVLGGVIMVLVDLLIEPLCHRLHFWKWTGDDVPIQNYISWFAVSLVMSAIVVKSKLKLDFTISTSVLILQVLFFIILNFAMNV